ncbi:sensor histidine kinase [Enterocloster clostridioformis]|uniref:sensor histidine kinase n=1 Tax=Enterocloster clostridioformis TaxID=1531 RepID=UPI00080C62CA|nr:sensor histidine kinase [Enterocloster clostridioformis]ANU48357.1 sensor histidine kinase [Lachnoclostridium sp. YL32]NDO29395.1 sensor histidine kinase [Enterocloster clostridioformis]OXE68938.1 sensor histidine kinase [Enterocloster clostridioformis]QQR02754.1 sensor histidine kinase [Enterocloster clostridioformis]
MEKRKQTCFRDEIRKSLIFHALAPCFISLVVLLLVFTAVGSQQIIRKSRAMLEHFSAEFEGVIDSYVDENKKMAGELDVELFKGRPSYKTEAVSDIYRFLNGQVYRGDYYLFDQERNLVFSTNSQPNVIQYIGNYLPWNTTDQNDSKNDCIFIYDNTVIDGRALPAWLMFQTVVKDGRLQGYSGFVLKADAFKERLGNMEQPVLLINKFNRLFTDGVSRFQNDRGKLVEEFRGSSMVHLENRWYYTGSVSVLDEEASVQVIYDCTSFVQLCLMSLVLVGFLALAVTLAIYRSAGKVADKKTEIIYDLIGALDQVEKGDLDVFLKITSGDEFERIGHSFNTMIGSIRHLLARHQELAKENLLATVQILESQFNPHFLFNTLESIRYMIKFGPGEAEKMLVSLSRMLRYSIQNGKDVVTVKEEMDFISRYLQVMLYRYGDRLRYSIDLEEGSRGASIPRMTLQPIVENSIKYGFGEDRDSLEIRISTRIQKGVLSVIIADDGVGIRPELLEELKANLDQGQNQTDHIGIYNVHKRIRLVYGSRYGVGIDSKIEEGTVVTLRVPCEE